MPEDNLARAKRKDTTGATPETSAQRERLGLRFGIEAEEIQGN